MEQKIDKEVFDTFFRENYVPVDYATVREEFYEITAVYWKTLEDLLKQFLKQLYAEKFAC